MSKRESGVGRIYRILLASTYCTYKYTYDFNFTQRTLNGTTKNWCICVCAKRVSWARSTLLTRLASSLTRRLTRRLTRLASSHSRARWLAHRRTTD